MRRILDNCVFVMYPFGYEIGLPATKKGKELWNPGIKIVKDEKMMEWLKEKNIPLEVCLTSNVKTGTVPTIEEHPIRKLYDFGTRLSLNTDDPAICDTTLSLEYQLAMEHFQFTLPEIKGLIMDTLEQSFLEDYRKKKLRPLLEQELSAI